MCTIFKHTDLFQVIEVTGTTEDNARTALYDSNNDTSRAIELILENNSLEQVIMLTSKKLVHGFWLICFEKED